MKKVVKIIIAGVTLIGASAFAASKIIPYCQKKKEEKNLRYVKKHGCACDENFDCDNCDCCDGESCTEDYYPELKYAHNEKLKSIIEDMDNKPKVTETKTTEETETVESTV